MEKRKKLMITKKILASIINFLSIYNNYKMIIQIYLLVEIVINNLLFNKHNNKIELILINYFYF